MIPAKRGLGSVRGGSDSVPLCVELHNASLSIRRRPQSIQRQIHYDGRLKPGALRILLRELQHPGHQFEPVQVNQAGFGHFILPLYIKRQIRRKVSSTLVPDSNVPSPFRHTRSGKSPSERQLRGDLSCVSCRRFFPRGKSISCVFLRLPRLRSL